LATIIVRSVWPELRNNIIQKGLAFRRDWSGTVGNSGRQGRSEILPRRLVGRDGASVVAARMPPEPNEDLNVKAYEIEVCEEANRCGGDHAYF
jgi:hypothetical protein